MKSKIVNINRACHYIYNLFQIYSQFRNAVLVTLNYRVKFLIILNFLNQVLFSTYSFWIYLTTINLKVDIYPFGLEMLEQNGQIKDYTGTSYKSIKTSNLIISLKLDKFYCVLSVLTHNVLCVLSVVNNKSYMIESVCLVHILVGI